MKDKNSLIKIYLDYLKKANENGSYEPTIDENTAIYNINHDQKYASLITDLNSVNDYESKRKIIGAFIAEEELKETKNEKDMISKIYGINVEDIEDLKLDNGVDVFTFYDEKLGRKRIIENIGEGTLVEQLKESQKDKLDFQTDDYKKNSDEILKSRAEDNSNRQELKMVDVNEYINNPENYGTINDETSSIVNQLIAMKDETRIKYINIENKVVLTDDNTVLEITKDEYGNIKFNKPIEWKNNVDEMDNSKKIENEVQDSFEYSDDSQIDTSLDNNNFEDQPEFISAEEIEAELNIQNLQVKITNIEKVKENIKYYYNHPEEIYNIEDPIEAGFYEKMVNEVYAVRKSEYEKKKNNTMSKTLTNPDLSNRGFVNLIFVSILLLFLAFMIFVF